ncbi:MAG: FAD-binding protein [Acidobacteria bacterium]|nr:FAD-binding protein [Acidobacteriota bacterium]
MVPAILRATIDTWNEDVARGVDRLFGRTIGTDIRQPETNGIMQAIVEPPFYAVPMHLVSPETTITTLGGVKINGRAQVINTSGGVIPRLYAAGSTTGGFIGPFYQQSGGGICQAYTMGRIAGKNAAAETPLP